MLWPALHNLPEYIASEYDDPRVLREHWSSYVRVNYQFAIDTVRNSRPQDFIWIHGNFFEEKRKLHLRTNQKICIKHHFKPLYLQKKVIQFYFLIPFNFSDYHLMVCFFLNFY